MKVGLPRHVLDYALTSSQNVLEVRLLRQYFIAMCSLLQTSSHKKKFLYACVLTTVARGKRHRKKGGRPVTDSCKLIVITRRPRSSRENLGCGSFKKRNFALWLSLLG